MQVRSILPEIPPCMLCSSSLHVSSHFKKYLSLSFKEESRSLERAELSSIKTIETRAHSYERCPSLMQVMRHLLIGLCERNTHVPVRPWPL